MNNLFFNPFISLRQSETLAECSYALNFLSESIHFLVLEELDVSSKAGLQVILSAIQHAIEFESKRDIYLQGWENFGEDLGALEKEFFNKYRKMLEPKSQMENKDTSKH